MKIDPDRRPDPGASAWYFRDEVLRMLFHPHSLSLFRKTFSSHLSDTSVELSDNATLREDHTYRLRNHTQLSDILSKQQDHPLYKTPAPSFDVRSSHSSPSQRSLYSVDIQEGILVEDFSF